MKQFKQRYLDLTSVADRRKIICENILTELFDYWIPRVPGGLPAIDIDGVSKVN